MPDPDDDIADDDDREGAIVGDGAAAPVAGTTAAEVFQDAGWRALRAGPHASSLALLLPGFVLRQPYGDDEPCDVVRFDEMEPGLDADAAAARLLHGNAALAAVLLLAEAFAEGDWEMRPSQHREVERLSLVLHRDGPIVNALSCARHALTERDALRLLAGGLMPLVAPRDGDTVRLLRWQSVSEPATALAGRWADAPR